MQVEDELTPVTLPGDGKDLVAFMSFAAVRGFGAQHPLIALADRFQTLGVKMGPLTTFYDATVEDAEDARKLEQVWQPPGPLRDALVDALRVLDQDPMAAALVRRAAAGDISDQIRALLDPLSRADERGARVRLVYTL